MEPLAYRMRPKTLEDIVGQDHIIGKDKPLYRMIKSDRLLSMILYGPPGVGKTTIAEVLAKITKYNFEKINAVTAGIADIRRVIEDTQNPLINLSGKSILFIDEIHRFNKAQQDVLLPYIENGTIVLIGATTENPYFEINKALISRTTVFKLNEIRKEDTVKVLQKAIQDEEGLGKYKLKIDHFILEKIAELSNGDIRTALNGLELAVLSTDISKDGYIHINEKIAEETFPEKKQYFDKNGDNHYDIASAMIKSIRGGDENASLHYLSRLLVAGEDIRFIARRLIISAAEDIGLGNPNALNMAVSCFNAVNVVGMPEARIILSETIIYLCKSKKSNSAYRAINMAIDDVKKGNIGIVPLHLRNATNKGASDWGYGKDYINPHYTKITDDMNYSYMPKELKGRKYYIPDSEVNRRE